MDLILKVIKKLQTCRGTLLRVNEVYGNSVMRQRAKEEMESKPIDLDKLIEYFNKFYFFSLWGSPSGLFRNRE